MQLFDLIGGPEGIRTLDLFHAMGAGGINLNDGFTETKDLERAGVARSGSGLVVVRRP